MAPEPDLDLTPDFFNIEAGFAKLWGNFGLILSLVYTKARAKRIQESGDILEKVENYPT